MLVGKSLVSFISVIGFLEQRYKSPIKLLNLLRLSSHTPGGGGSRYRTGPAPDPMAANALSFRSVSKVRSFSRSSKPLREQRARLYIIWRCTVLLVCWHD